MATEVKALKSLLHQHNEQHTIQMESFEKSLTVSENHTNKIISVQHQILLSKIEEQASLFRQELDKEIHLRSDCITGLADQVSMYEQELGALRSCLHHHSEQYTSE